MYPNNRNNHFTSRGKSTRFQSPLKKRQNKSELFAYIPYTAKKKIDSKAHVNYTEEEEKHIKEPCPICAICGKPINFISEALVAEDGNGYVHFDCALSKAIETLKPNQNEKVSYMGSGKFAKILITKNENVYDERLRRSRSVFEFEISSQMEFESKENFEKMQDMVEGLRQ